MPWRSSVEQTSPASSSRPSSGRTTLTVASRSFAASPRPEEAPPLRLGKGVQRLAQERPELAEERVAGIPGEEPRAALELAEQDAPSLETGELHLRHAERHVVEGVRDRLGVALPVALDVE